jgi:hypothetical protein
MKYTGFEKTKTPSTLRCIWNDLKVRTYSVSAVGWKMLVLVYCAYGSPNHLNKNDKQK